MKCRCVVCDIVDNRIPSWIIFQNEQTICFLPKEMDAYGHTLIAPKAHYADLYAASEEILGPILATVQKLALSYRQRLGAVGFNLLHASGAAAQQSVFHLHFHLIPRFEQDGLNAWPPLLPAQYDKEEVWQKLRFQ